MKNIVIIIAAIMLPVSAFSQGASTLNWFASTPIEDHFGNTLVSDPSDPSVGAMVQLIGFPFGSGPANGPDESLANGVDTSNGNDLHDTSFTRSGSGNNGEFFQSGTFGAVGSTYDFGAAPFDTLESVFVRIFDRPSAGGGNLPDARNVAGFGFGFLYFDTIATTVGSLPNSAGFYDYDVQTAALNGLGDGSIGAGDWAFLSSTAAIPEPNTIMLLGLGTVAILLRRARRA